MKQVCLELLTLTVAVRDADDGMQYIAEAEEDDALPSTKILRVYSPAQYLQML